MLSHEGMDQYTMKGFKWIVIVALKRWISTLDEIYSSADKVQQFFQCPQKVGYFLLQKKQMFHSTAGTSSLTWKTSDISQVIHKSYPSY